MPLCFDFSGGPELVDQLLKDEFLCKQKSSIEGLEDMKLLLRYCELYGVLDKVNSICDWGR